MKNSIPFLLLLGLLLFFSSSCTRTSDPVFTKHRHVKIGDTIEWKSPEWDDSNWKHWVYTYNKGIFWSRLKLDIPETTHPRTKQGLMVGCSGSYEAYWDGHYIGTNSKGPIGVLPEQAGDYISYFPLPDSLVKPGPHVLALRSFKTHKLPTHHAYMVMDDYRELLVGPFKSSLIMFMLAGGYLVAAIYFLFLFLNRFKDISLLIFCCICLLFAVLVILEYYKSVQAYPYPFQRTRLEIIGYSHLALSLLIPWFLMLQFRFPWKKALMGLGLVGIFLLEYFNHGQYDSVARQHNMLVEVLSFIIVGYACWQRISGAYVVLLAFLSSLVLTFMVPRIDFAYVSHFDVMLFISFTLIMLSMLYVYSLRRREEQEAFEASLVLSERLKNELLKKNIKPHFIMNTLTSLIDWVEEAPKEGVQFIQALAGEFEVLNDIADYQLVPIEQEIRLCKRHLEVMSYRKEIHYSWEEVGIDQNEIIPPAIIHTAVENGVTHSLPNIDGTIRFHFSFTKNEIYKQYTLQTLATIRQPNDQPEIKDGTGMKYIKARLQESYPNRWQLWSEPTPDGWEVRIRIYE